MGDSMKYDHNNVTLSINKEIPLTSKDMELFYDQVALDTSFNSMMRWEISQMVAFITSVVTGMAPSKIIVANIDSCLTQSVEDSSDYNYFAGWKSKNKKYIALDGNNRTITINRFLNGEVPLAHGEYALPTGTVIVNASNDKYPKLPEKMMDHIQGITISVCEYITATRSDLSRLFINVNDGVALNSQELRNAILVPYASSIRELVQEYASSYRYIFKNNNRRVIDEQFVNLTVYYTFGATHGINKTDKDNAYEENSTVWKDFSKDGRKVIEDTMKIVDKYANNGFKTTSIMLNFFMIMVQLSKEKRTILDKERLFKWFVEGENKRLGDLTPIATTAHGEMRAYSGSCDSTSDVFLKARYEVIMRDLESIPEGIVAKLDVERLFSNAERYQMWAKQKGVCPQTGKVIPQDEINDHTKWAADHIYPYSKGGATTLANGQLVCKLWNEQKGAKLMEELAA